jgi:hypothetical protein
MGTNLSQMPAAAALRPKFLAADWGKVLTLTTSSRKEQKIKEKCFFKN